jgi:hypothetical protein
VTVSNLTGRTTRAPVRADLVVAGADGRELWGTETAFAGVDYPMPQATIPPHGSARTRMTDVVVRWPGALVLRARCVGLPDLRPLPAIPVEVTAPGTTPSREQALHGALALSGGLFEHCTPGVDGASVTGRINPPRTEDASFPNVPDRIPPMTARCLARITRAPGFDVVTLSFVTPADAPSVTLGRYVRILDALSLPGTGSIGAARWVFVVTERRTIEALPLEGLYRTRTSSGYSVGYAYERRSWAVGSTGRCGGQGLGGLVFINLCPK